MLCGIRLNLRGCMLPALRLLAAASIALVMCIGPDVYRHVMTLLFLFALPLATWHERRVMRVAVWQSVASGAAYLLQKRSASEADHSTSPQAAPSPHLSTSDR